MPLVRLPNAKLLYFAHVPKCAGTAVERYLIARFGALGMHDARYARRSAADAWSLSPPQHMPEPVRADLLPDTLFDALFATVRHPVLRLRSAFLFQREIEKALPSSLVFARWVNELPRILAMDPYALHGHLRPMAELVPAKAVVFRLEDGLAPLVDWLDDQAGAQDGAREIGTANVLRERLKSPPKVTLSAAVCRSVARLYAADYERFGYSEDPGEGATQA